MRQGKCIGTGLLWLMLVVVVTAQETWMPVLSRPDTLPKEHAGGLFLRLSNNNFLFDAEYFSPLEVGYTWIGLQLQPEVVWQYSEHFLLRGGVYLLKYSGRDDVTDVRPVLAAVYRFSPRVTLVMGSLYGSLNHGLPQPLYRYDRSMADWPEEGVQLLVNTTRLKGDYWLQWRNFILPGDPFQEQLVFGTSSRLFLMDRDGWRLVMPLSTMVHHQGGQIDSSPEPVHTYGNLGGGLTLRRHLGEGVLKAAEGSLLYFHYFDASGQPLYYDVTSGHGIWVKATVHLSNLEAGAGYWYGRDFYSFLGEPLFASVSEHSAGKVYPVRSLLTYRLAYAKELEKGISITLYGNGYQDLRLRRFDYNVGLQLLFHVDVRIPLKKRDIRDE